VVGRLTEIAELPDLQHLVLDTDPVLVGPPAQALFSPCTVEHTSSAECRAWDDIGPGPVCRTYRYALTRHWDPGLPPAVFVMLNPSVADAFKTDPTIIRCLGFARSWECGGLLVLNAFGLRSTSPMPLRRHVDPVGPDNGRVIEAALAAGGLGPVVTGWGTNIAMRRDNRGDRLIELLRAAGVKPHYLRLNDDGSPQHPLFARGELVPTPFPDPRTPAVSREGGHG
jgi:hypothetical protein